MRFAGWLARPMNDDDPVEFVPLREFEPLIQEWRDTNPEWRIGPRWSDHLRAEIWWGEGGSYLLVKAARTLNGGETWERFPYDRASRVTPEDALRAALVAAVTDGPQVGEDLVTRYEATFQCERYSETWQDCPTETTGPDAEAVEWCRSCKAKARVKIT